ncbi:tail fiber domain-containing protein [Chitinophaga sp. NPDC101104]|uniref:tail fiber domain-containing protein n=1 Tax=Chitinophaga sp. NPDC101104 TaxID=3390561 RepID=UPI003CFF5576
MKKLLAFIALISGVVTTAHAQHVYQIRADSVRIYNVCDTAELIIENRTRGVSGYLYNKSNGRTEFRKIDLVQIGGSKLAIAGQDTIDLSQMSGVGGIDTIYRVGDSLQYVKRGIVNGIYAPVNPPDSATTLASVTRKGNFTPYDIRFNSVGANPSNGLIWIYNTDYWRIFVESLQDTPAGNMIFESNDNGQEGWIFRAKSANIPTNVLSLGKDRMTFLGRNVLNDSTHVPGSAFSQTFSNAMVPQSFTTNASGHITGLTTRNLTPADIGAAKDTISLAGVLSNGNKAVNSIQLGEPGVSTSLNYFLMRNLSGVNYTGSMGLGIDQTSLTLTVFNGVDSLRKLFYIPFNGTGPMYSGNNGTTKFKLWHSGNDGLGSGLDADLLDGMAPDINATVSTIAQRNITGQLFATYFNTSAPVQTMTPTKIFGSNDNYIRALDAASVRGFLGMPASGDDLQSVTDRGFVSVRNGENLTIKKAAATAGDLFIRFRNSDNSERGYIGYGSSVNNTFVIHNADNSPTKIIQRLLVNNPSEDDSTSGLQVRGQARFGGVLLQNGFSPNPENNTINQFWNSMGGASVTIDPEFRRGWNGLNIYNNVGGSNAITIERSNAVLNAAVPNTSGYYLKVTSTPGASPNNILPGLGGIRLNYGSSENKVYVTRIKANIPVGYTLMPAANAFGTNSYNYWLTSNKGTGKWEDYIHVYAAGNAGDFNTLCYFYLDGPIQATSWYLGYFDFKIASASSWTDNVPQNLATGRPTELYLDDDSVRLSKGDGPNLKITSPHGNLQLGVLNPTFAHYVTDREGHYFNKPVQAASKIAIYNSAGPTAATTYLTQTEGRINNSLILTEASAAGSYVKNQFSSAQTGSLWLTDHVKTNAALISKIGQGYAAFRLHNSNDLLRWGMGLNNTESAGTGGDFHLWRYDDAGTVPTLAMSVNRSNGNVIMPGQVHSGNGSRIIGSEPGPNFYSWLGFYDYANRRYGYVGKGGISNVDMQIASDSGNVHIIPKGGLLDVGKLQMSYNGGTLLLNNGTSNILTYSSGLGVPTFTTRSAGTKIVFNPALSANSVDYAFGLESNNVWFSTATAATGFKWYGGATNIASLTGAGNLTLSGSATATAFYQSSLRSLKKDIQPFSVSALDVLGKAQVRTFRFKADSTGHRNIGFIADEVPDEMATPGRNGVDQASTVGLLVKAVQELKAEKEQLSAENKALADRLIKLEAAMENILKQQKAGK